MKIIKFKKRYVINWERVYTLVLTIAFVYLACSFISVSTRLSERIERLENQKNEAVHDYQSVIQLQK